jgi:UMF1 family MFS transporter
MFSQLIPDGRGEGEAFSLYEIGEKGTSWLGPLLFGTVADVRGLLRPAIVSLVVFFVVGGVALAFVPMRRAIRAAGNKQPLRA